MAYVPINPDLPVEYQVPGIYVLPPDAHRAIADAECAAGKHQGFVWCPVFRQVMCKHCRQHQEGSPSMLILDLYVPCAEHPETVIGLSVTV